MEVGVLKVMVVVCWGGWRGCVCVFDVCVSVVVVVVGCVCVCRGG